MSETEGVKFDEDKPRWDLLPFDALDDVAAVLRFGAKKYAPRNWEKGMAWGRLSGAAMRHLASWACGTELDHQSKLPHLAHAACCVLMLLALTKRGVGTDDRHASLGSGPSKAGPDTRPQPRPAPTGIPWGPMP